MYKTLIAILLSVVFLSCQKSQELENMQGSWSGNLFVVDKVKGQVVQLELQKDNQYVFTAMDGMKEIYTLCEGHYNITNGKIQFETICPEDTNQFIMLHALNNRPVKHLQVNETEGIQIKINNVWQFLEKVN